MPPETPEDNFESSDWSGRTCPECGAEVKSLAHHLRDECNRIRPDPASDA